MSAHLKPVFAMGKYTDIGNDDQYIRADFIFDYGPLKLGNFKLGDTSLAAYGQVEFKMREGQS